jgi:hypothetical protein
MFNNKKGNNFPVSREGFTKTIRTNQIGPKTEIVYSAKHREMCKDEFRISYRKFTVTF